MTKIIPGNLKTCPFLGKLCQQELCALYLPGAKVCSIVAIAVWSGDSLGAVKELKQKVSELK